MTPTINELIKCFDNGGKTADRYLVVFLKSARSLPQHTEYDSVSMSSNPEHPHGVCIHSLAVLPNTMVGEEISYNELPPACQKIVKYDLITYSYN